jgi:SAM-dependent methyltransferase
MALLFAVALFVSAFLLFWVQPLAGKMVLPLLGGTPAVWNTCMLFFQAVLLAGYAYALALTRWLSARAQVVLHGALLLAAALALPVAVGEASAGGVPAGASPAWWLLKTLLLTVGPPFFVLSASAPLLQKWFSRTRDASASDPYFLYAASNAGSLVALLGFPVLLEPNLTLGRQSHVWALAYGTVAVLVVACATFALRSRAAGRDETTRGGAQGSATANPSPENVDPSAEASSAEAAGASSAEASSADYSERLSLWRRLRWLLLAFVPSSLVLGATTYITTDLVAVPLLWVIPLSLYLLSFVLVFAQRQLLSRGLMARVLPGSAVMLALVYLSGASQPAWFLILFHLLFLFAASMVCHGQLADDRPAARHLAEFYLWLAAGGALGGLCNAVIAPLVFNTVVEYPLVILLASYLRPAFRRERGRLLGLRLGAPRTESVRGVGASKDNGGETFDSGETFGDEGDAGGDEARVGVYDVLLPLLVGAFAAALVLVAPHLELKTVERAAVSLGAPLFLLNYFFAPRPLRFTLGLAAVMASSFIFSQQSGRTLFAERNFFGTHLVDTDRTERIHWLHHGSTLHGKQYTDPAHACEPLSYYHRDGPLGSIFAAFDAKPAAARRVAVVGLGAGTTAAYARRGETWTFYEIDPAVVGIARRPELFTYLSACSAAPVTVLLGDARLRLREAEGGAYDLIALDAFSSDAVPAHLLTREALALYLSKLAPGGVIAFHVSNRSLELERVVGGLAADAGLPARVFADKRYDPETGIDPSTWVAVARSTQDLGALAGDARWQMLDAGTYQLELWRDDFSNVVRIFKWF